MGCCCVQMQSQLVAQNPVTSTLLTPEQIQRYRTIGAQLAEFCNGRDLREVSAAALSSLLADLAADQVTLVPPLRDLFSRREIRSFLSQTSRAQATVFRDGLLQELHATYAPFIVEALGEVLNGLLALPSEAASTPVVERRSVENRPVEQRSVERRRRRSVRSIESKRSRPEQVTSRKRVNPRGVLALCVASAVLLAAGGIAVRQFDLCRVAGLCRVKAIDADEETGFAAAQAAELALRQASSLDDYRSALEQLEEQVLILRDASLSPQQQKRWKGWDETALQARRILTAETADLDRLGLADAALKRVAELDGPARDQEVALVRQYLDAIPASSFSATRASDVRQRLDQILSVSPETTTKPATEATSEPSPAPNAVPASPPAPTTAP